ncbi:MAG: hypothetical protein AAF840_07220, partial [Bacteroidota bacterium]
MTKLLRRYRHTIYQYLSFLMNSYLGEAAGARKGKSSQHLVFCLFALGGLLPFAAYGQADSLRQVYAAAFRQDKSTPNWRVLVSACSGEESCLAETAAWARGLNPGLEPQLWEYAGEYATSAGDRDLALAHFRRGLRLAHQAGNQYMIGILHNRIGYLYTHFWANTDSAAFHLYAAIAVFEATEDTEIWEPLYNLAYLNDQMAMRDRAVEYMEQAYLSAKAGGRRADYGFVLYHLLSWAIKDERHAILDRYFPEYTEFRAGSKSLDPQHDALLLSIQDDDAGFEALKAYEAKLSQRGDRIIPSMDIAYSVLGGGHAARGNYQEALRCFKEAVRL